LRVKIIDRSIVIAYRSIENADLILEAGMISYTRNVDLELVTNILQFDSELISVTY